MVRRLVLVATVAAMLLLLPANAWALPGPEVVAPIAVGMAHLVVVLGWLAGRLQRRWQRSRWRWAVLIAIGAVFALLINVDAAVLAVMLAGALGAVGSAARWRWAVALLLCLTASILTQEPAQSLPDLRPYGPEALPEGPLPQASVPWLRSNPVLLIHMGEPEQFSNCRSSIGTVLRAADLPEVLPELGARQVPVVLVVPGLEDLGAIQAAVSGLGDVQVLSLGQAFPRRAQDGAVSYAPPFAQAFYLLVPKRLLPHSVPAGPLELDGAPWLRPQDLSHLLARRPSVRLIHAHRVVETPSRELARWQGGPAVLIGEDLGRLAAATRLLRDQGVTLIAMGEGVAPASPPTPPLDISELLWAILLAAISALAVRALAQFAALRAEVAHATGRAAGWLAPVLRAASEPCAVALCVFWAFDAASNPIPPALGLWVTPTMVSPAASYLGVACLALATLALWLAVSRVTNGRRLVAAVLVAVLVLAALPGVVTGSGLLPLHLAVVAAGLLGTSLCAGMVRMLWRRIGRARAGRNASWLWLSDADELAAARGKAARLGSLRRRGLPVPPGLVVWTDGQGRIKRAALRAIRLLLGTGPWLIRSSAAAEDREEESAAGRFSSRVCPSAEYLERTIGGVAAAYGSLDTSRPAVLVMPLVVCTRGGVAQSPVPGTSAALVESGRGRDGVTSGRAVQRSYWGRHSRRWLEVQRPQPELQALAKLLDRLDETSGSRPRYWEWLARQGHAWVVQDRAAPASVEAVAQSPLEGLLDQIEPPPGPDSPWLRRVANDGLPRVMSMRTARLWARPWRRADAVGDAFELLGMPRALAPKEAVVAAWGAPWAITSQVDIMVRMVRLRLLAAATVRLRSVASVASGLAQRVIARPSSLRDALARSMALGMLEPFLPAGDPPGSTSPSVELARALRKAQSPLALASRWGYRATWDLDPTCPRYGELADPRWEPPPSAASWPPDGVPEVCGRRCCAALRDGLHDWLAWEVARLRATDDTWHDVEAIEAPGPELESMSLRDAEAVGLPLEVGPKQRAGTWVSGSGPVEGMAERDPLKTGPDRVLLIDVPTPEMAAHFDGFAAVVASSGGALSHAALVARELGVPALFGVGRSVARHEGRVRLEEDGSVVWLDADP